MAARELAIVQRDSRPPDNRPGDGVLIEPPDSGVKTYLAATGAVAIYVSTDNGNVVSVGVARDLDQALRHLRTLFSPMVRFGWIAWGNDYRRMVEIAQVPDLIYVNGIHGIKVRRQVDDVAALITKIASENCVTLTPHGKVLERANVYAVQLDDAIAAMQQAGAFATFNQAYKTHRLELARKGESAAPYWAVMAEMRAVIVRLLIAQGKSQFSPHKALEEIRAYFPWFTRWRKNGRANKHRQAIDKAQKMK